MTIKLEIKSNVKIDEALANIEKEHIIKNILRSPKTDGATASTDETTAPKLPTSQPE